MTSLSHLTAEELADTLEDFARHENFKFTVSGRELLRECAARLRGKVASGLLLSVENVLVDYIETIEKTGASLYHGRSVLEQVRATLRTQYVKELAATTAQGADNEGE